MALLLLPLIGYFARPVRDRMNELHEPFRSAVIPTTVLIGGYAYDCDWSAMDVLSGRMFINYIPRVPSWQTGLYARALKRRLIEIPDNKSLPAYVSRDEDTILGNLATHSEVASNYYAELMLEHPDAAVRQNVAFSIVARRLRGTKVVVNPAIRTLFWQAMDEDRIPKAFFDFEFDAFGPEQLVSLSDERILHELTFLGERTSDALLELYLQEAVRRHLSSAIPIVKALPENWSRRRVVLLQTALSRLANEPDPITIKLIPHDHLRDFFIAEISLTAKNQDVLQLWRDGQDKVIFLPITITYEQGGEVKQRAWEEEFVLMRALGREQPHRLMVHPYNLPPRCKVRMRMDIPSIDPTPPDPSPHHVQLMPVSNELELIHDPGFP